MSELIENSAIVNFRSRTFSPQLGGLAKSYRSRSEIAEKLATCRQQQAAETEQTTPKRILVVDDQQVMVDLITEILTHTGYEIVCATNGQEAVETARTFEGKIDAIILDVFMPVMSGIEAFPLLQEARPGIPTVLCSGSGPNDAIQAILDSGAASFVQKPFRVQELIDEIRCALQSSTAYVHAS